MNGGCMNILLPRHSVCARLQLSVLCLVLGLLTVPAQSVRLLNVQFDAHLAPGFVLKRGPAAVGQSTNDYWNLYSRDLSSAWDWQEDGRLTTVFWADGTSSSAQLKVTNAG